MCSLSSRPCAVACISPWWSRRGVSLHPQLFLKKCSGEGSPSVFKVRVCVLLCAAKKAWKLGLQRRMAKTASYVAVNDRNGQHADRSSWRTPDHGSWTPMTENTTPPWTGTIPMFGTETKKGVLSQISEAIFLPCPTLLGVPHY
jgi:hypothetical protein